MTKEQIVKQQIVKLAIDNDVVEEVYSILHHIIMTKLDSLEYKSDRLNSDLRLIKKYADADKLDVIKDILAESEE